MHRLGINVGAPVGHAQPDVFRWIAHCLTIRGEREVQILVAEKDDEHLRLVEVRPAQPLSQRNRPVAERRKAQFADWFGNSAGVVAKDFVARRAYCYVRIARCRPIAHPVILRWLRRPLLAAVGGLG